MSLAKHKDGSVQQLGEKGNLQPARQVLEEKRLVIEAFQSRDLPAKRDAVDLGELIGTELVRIAKRKPAAPEITEFVGAVPSFCDTILRNKSLLEWRASCPKRVLDQGSHIGRHPEAGDEVADI